MKTHYSLTIKIDVDIAELATNQKSQEEIDFYAAQMIIKVPVLGLMAETWADATGEPHKYDDAYYDGGSTVKTVVTKE